RNPHDPSKIPGGRSGGNAAGVAARFAPAGIGSDTGGSTRIPAALCGVVGFRPTVGRYAGTGTLAGVREVVPIAHTRDTPGPIARSVSDVALLDAVITGEARALRRADLRGLRLGVARRSFFADLDAELEEVVDEALDQLQDSGVVLVEVDIPNLEALNAGAAHRPGPDGGTQRPAGFHAPHLHPPHRSRLQRRHSRGERADRPDRRWPAGRPRTRRACGERPAIARHRARRRRSLRIPARAEAGPRKVASGLGLLRAP